MIKNPYPGKFIVIYGINNIGKSTQVKMLVESLKQKGLSVEQIKVPLYDLEPTGPRLNKILRNGAEPEISIVDLQTIYAQNRRDYEPTLRNTLSNGTWVVAEDYKGTGIAWGWTRGAALEEMERINEGLYQEDCAILLDGERFAGAKEQNHIHEVHEELIRLSREKHLLLAKRYDWKVIQANQTKNLIHEAILEELQTRFYL